MTKSYINQKPKGIKKVQKLKYSLISHTISTNNTGNNNYHFALESLTNNSTTSNYDFKLRILYDRYGEVLKLHVAAMFCCSFRWGDRET